VDLWYVNEGASGREGWYSLIAFLSTGPLFRIFPSGRSCVSHRLYIISGPLSPPLSLSLSLSLSILAYLSPSRSLLFWLFLFFRSSFIPRNGIPVCVARFIFSGNATLHLRASVCKCQRAEEKPVFPARPCLSHLCSSFFGKKNLSVFHPCSKHSFTDVPSLSFLSLFFSLSLSSFF